MYDVKDTITAISSASPHQRQLSRSIIRVSGSDAQAVAATVFAVQQSFGKRGVTQAVIDVGPGIEVDALVYCFPGPGSYTGEDLIELHFFAAGVVVEKVLTSLLTKCRLAGPGEFTLRAYLNGKLDLSQAEAVAQIVAGSNRFQLAAAEKLLSGNLSKTIADVRSRLLDIMTLIEAGLDFSEEDIEFVTSEQGAETIRAIEASLREILESSIRYEELIDLPSVGLAGAANAGKSSLINALLQKERSIISDSHGTTRDVLTDVLETDKCRCAIFDCAGLGVYGGYEQILDQLAQQAAIEAIKTADFVIFCVDAAKDDYSEDAEIIKSISGASLIPVMTKCDLLNEKQVLEKSDTVDKLFDKKPLTISSLSGFGIEDLLKEIESALLAKARSSFESAEKIAVNERHRRLVTDALDNIARSAVEMSEGSDEVAAMYLRNAYDLLAGLEREDIDEAILDKIFSSFCIGK